MTGRQTFRSEHHPRQGELRFALIVHRTSLARDANRLLGSCTCLAQCPGLSNEMAALEAALERAIASVGTRCLQHSPKLAGKVLAMLTRATAGNMRSTTNNRRTTGDDRARCKARRSGLY
jgi:hypothetical protein